MALPWLIGAAVVAGVGYLASDDDECIYCERTVYKDDMCRKHYRKERDKEQELLQKESKRDDRRKIESEIESFKETSKRQIDNKYGVKISFSKADVNIIVSNPDNGFTYLKDSITMLNDTNIDIENLISDLQRAKDAI